MELRQALESPSLVIQSAEWVSDIHLVCSQIPEDGPDQAESVAVEQTARPYSGMGNGVEKWRPLVESYFGSETDLALCVMAGESGGNPDAYNPTGASGLMQVMPFWADYYNVPRDNLFIPEVNIWIASEIRAEQGWSAWSAYSRC